MSPRARLGRVERHAGEAHAAGPAIVEGLLVLEQPAPCRADRVEHCIGRGQAADAPAVADLRRPCGTSRRDRRPRPGRASRRRTGAPAPGGAGRPGWGRRTPGPTWHRSIPPMYATFLPLRRLHGPQRLDESAARRGPRSGRSPAPSGRGTSRPGSARSRSRGVRPADTGGRRPGTRSNARSGASARRRTGRGPPARRSDRRRSDRSGPRPSGVSKSLHVSANRRRQYWCATPRITKVSAWVRSTSSLYDQV